ncbi:hypothetical protein ACFYO2_26445 [Streptomyces sp. NPDC006602]|uniref:hypothetical protein n=1 Tax=Streptomyces sp. NPDC006602 TaxID=3364751 RepID=UPI0036B34B30
MSTSATPWYIKGILYVALPAACLAALYLSIPGEVDLARTAGWSERYAPAMPVCLSVYALSAGAIATYRRKMKLPGQVTALIGSVMALLLAMSAQSISHLIEQSYMEGSALLVVAVSCVPPLTIAHLVHMAETPTQVKSAAEELEELRDLTQTLMTALVASESRALLSHSGRVLVEVERVSQTVEELTEEAEELSEELEGSLNEGRAAKPRRKVLALTRETIEQTRETLKAEGKKPTVERVCEALGISQASYYRYRAA